MPRLSLASPLLATVLLVCGCAATPPPAVDLVAARAQVEANNARFGEGLRAKDAAMIGALYTDDAEFMEPGGARRTGRVAIEAYWRESLAFLTDMTLRTTSLSGTRDVLYETGEVDTDITLADGTRIVQRDKYVNVWRLGADGTYGLAVDIWNAQPDEQPGRRHARRSTP